MLPERKKSAKIGVLDDFKSINLFSLMGKQPVCLIFKLWEAVMLNESILILADSPINCRYTRAYSASLPLLYNLSRIPFSLLAMSTLTLLSLIKRLSTYERPITKIEMESLLVPPIPGLLRTLKTFLTS